MPIRRVVSVALFIQAASVGMVFALLAELQNEHGLSTTSIGVISAVGLFGGVVGQVGLAPLADRGWGRELMIAAQLIGAVGAFGFAFGGTLWHFILFRAVSGIALGAYEPAAQALATTRDPDRAGEILGKLAGVKIAGLLIGPGLGAIVASMSNIDAPFILTGVGLLLATPWLARVAPTAPVAPPEGAATPRRELAFRGPVFVAIVLTMAIQLPVGLYDAIWAILMEDRGASTLFTGITLSLYGIPFIALAPLGGRWADRYGAARTMPYAFVLVAGITVVYGSITRPGILVSLALVEATGNAFGLPAAQAVMARATAEHERAMGFGLAAATGQIAAGIVALVSASLYAAHGQFTTFATLAATVAVVGGIGLVLLFRSDVGGPLEPPRTPHEPHSPGGDRSPGPSPA